MLVHWRVTLSIKFAGTHLYTWVERGTVRVKCLAQEHNTMSPSQGSNPDHSIQSWAQWPWGHHASTTLCRAIQNGSLEPPQKQILVFVCFDPFFSLFCWWKIGNGNYIHIMGFHDTHLSLYVAFPIQNTNIWIPCIIWLQVHFVKANVRENSLQTYKPFGFVFSQVPLPESWGFFVLLNCPQSSVSS